MDKTTERDREATERRLLESVGTLVREQGFERIGVNAVAEHAGVSKILIYRYFGSMDGLLAAYIRQHDFWINYPSGIPDGEPLPAFIKRIFRDQVRQLRGDAALRRLYRWELSTDNELVAGLRRQREQAGLARTQAVCGHSSLPDDQVAVLAMFVTASITYLCMLADFCPVYNGIPIAEDAGWERIVRGIDRLVDTFFEA